MTEGTNMDADCRHEQPVGYTDNGRGISVCYDCMQVLALWENGHSGFPVRSGGGAEETDR